MYLLLAPEEALIVDPNVDEDAVTLLRERQIGKLKIVLTHSHYDHILGVQFFQERFDCTVIGTELCLECLPDPKRNLSRFAGLVFNGHGLKREEMPAIPRISCHGDLGFEGTYTFPFGGMTVALQAFPGHSPDSLMMRVGDGLLFTGDNLIPDTRTALTLPGSDPEAYELKVKPFLRGLPGGVTVFPGHGSAGRLDRILRCHPDYAAKE